jgi:hypothetical protein
VKVKPWAGFIADFPDDQVEDGGDIKLFGGRNVAVAIGEILTGLGCRVSAPEYAELHGWDFDAYYQDRRFWCQVTSFHPAFHLLLDDPAVTRGTRKKNAAAYAELAEKAAAALEADPRFHRVEWRSMEDGPPEPGEIGPSGIDEGAYGATAIGGPARTNRVFATLLGIWSLLSRVAFGLLFYASLVAVGWGALFLITYRPRQADSSDLWFGLTLFCVGSLVLCLLLGWDLWLLLLWRLTHRPKGGTRRTGPENQASSDTTEPI